MEASVEPSALGWLDLGIDYKTSSQRTWAHLDSEWIDPQPPPPGILQGGITSTKRRLRESEFSPLPTVPENCDGVLRHFGLSFGSSLRWFPLLEPFLLSRCWLWSGEYQQHMNCTPFADGGRRVRIKWISLTKKQLYTVFYFYLFFLTYLWCFPKGYILDSYGD